jgi:hypothetical protein
LACAPWQMLDLGPSSMSRFGQQWPVCGCASSVSRPSIIFLWAAFIVGRFGSSHYVDAVGSSSLRSSRSLHRLVAPLEEDDGQTSPKKL